MKFFILMSEVLSLHAYAKKPHAYIEGFWISLSLPFLSEVKAAAGGGGLSSFFILGDKG